MRPEVSQNETSPFRFRSSLPLNLVKVVRAQEWKYETRLYITIFRRQILPAGIFQFLWDRALIYHAMERFVNSRSSISKDDSNVITSSGHCQSIHSTDYRPVMYHTFFPFSLAIFSLITFPKTLSKLPFCTVNCIVEPPSSLSASCLPT
jgi:hypothetical protein